MFTSSADVFRTRQAVRDLVEVVQLHRDAIDRLGGSGADREAIRALIRHHGKIPPDATRLYSALQFGAATPDEDFARFAGSTAILLLDRLQDGAGTDDLYWNWDAFCDHYRLADPPVRAALMNGYRTGYKAGRVTLDAEPNESDCLTFGRNDVLERLRAGRVDALAEAVDGDYSPERAGELWTAAASGRLSWAMRAGFRYLYERPASLGPVDPEHAALIPWT